MRKARILITQICVLLVLSILFNLNTLYAQGIGINDTGAIPNARAVLDVDISTNDAGVLLPRLTTTQRNALTGSLTGGEEGLVVYDEDIDAFFYWDGAIWQQVLNTTNPDEDWTAEVDKVYNITDSIGIGTTAPAAMLHVAGNVQVDDNVVLNSNSFELTTVKGTLVVNGDTYLGNSTFDRIYTYTDIDPVVPGLDLGSSSMSNRFENLYLEGDIHMYTAAAQLRFRDAIDSYLINVENLPQTGIFYSGATDNRWEWHGAGIQMGYIDLDNGDFSVAGSMRINSTASDALLVKGDIRIGEELGTDDDYMYFDGGGSEYLGWLDNPGQFILSDQLSLAGDLRPSVSTTFNLGSSMFSWDTLFARSLLFGETGPQLTWNAIDGVVEVSDDTEIAGDLSVSGSLSVAGALNPYIHVSGDTMHGDLIMLSSDILLNSGSEQLRAVHDNDAYLINVDNSASSGIYFSGTTDNRWEWHGAGVTKAYLDLDDGTMSVTGFIGVGTNDPDTNLHVIGNVKMVDGNQAAGRLLTSDADGIGSWTDPLTVETAVKMLISDSDGNTRIHTEESPDENKIRFDVSGSQAMIVDDTGDIGIGTDTPAEKLHVVTSGEGNIRLENGSTQVYSLWSSHASAPWIGTATSHPFSIATAGSNRLNVTAAGNVGIGVSSPTYPLEVNGNMKVSGDYITGATDGVLNAGGAIDVLANVIGDDVSPANTVAMGDEDLYIEDDLEVLGSAYKTDGGMWSTISDARLKKNVVDYTDGLSQILQIRPVTFRYNGTVNPQWDNGKTQIGILAQEIQDIAPYTVDEIRLGRRVEEHEGDHETVIDSGEPYLVFNGSALTFMLINGIQEQQQIITSQQAQIDELRARLEMLENK